MTRYYLINEQSVVTLVLRMSRLWSGPTEFNADGSAG